VYFLTKNAGKHTQAYTKVEVKEEPEQAQPLLEDGYAPYGHGCDLD
jgi:hypothetical protein